MLSRVFTTREQLLLVGSAAAICIGGVTYYVAQPRIPAAAVEVRELQIPAPQKAVEPVSKPALLVQQIVATPPAAPTHRISVSVSGAVTTPGMYELDEGDRVDDAINAAGGASATADLSDINKAAKLIDGSALVLPVGARAGIEDGKRLVLRSGQDAASLNPTEYTISGWKRAPRSSVAEKSAASAAPGRAQTNSTGLLDLNSASAEELETLPGVGPKLADAIVQYRTQQPFQTVDDLDNVPGFGAKRLADIRPHVTVGPQ